MSTAEEMMNGMTEGEITDEEAGEAAGGGSASMRRLMNCPKMPGQPHRFAPDKEGRMVCEYCKRMQTEILSSSLGSAAKTTVFL